MPTADSGKPTTPPIVGLSLTRNNRLLSYERRLKLWLTGIGATILTLSGLWLRPLTGSSGETAAFLLLGMLLYLLLADVLFRQLIRPLQTLANIIAALREGDYSFRARGARAGDTVGDLAVEINALSGALQEQRTVAQDALTLLERVLTSMHSPVLAFDADARLRLLNPAAREAFSLGPGDAVGRSAHELNLTRLLALEDHDLFPLTDEHDKENSVTAPQTRWSVRRGTFRLNGIPHRLLVLSDVAAALREEERLAWQRLIRVLSHEINNSLTPIQSIAGSLRSRSAKLAEEQAFDFARGLSIIEERAASLSRFLGAYQRLTHLPTPRLKRHRVESLVSPPAQLEVRLLVSVVPGPEVAVLCDSDQIEQALINLLRNAVDAALSPEAIAAGHSPFVQLTWTVVSPEVHIVIEDSGLGIENPSNLFIPFYTTKPQGSGIGLVLAQSIAAAHRGAVSLQSKPGQHGCTATLALPIDCLSEQGTNADAQ